MLAERTPEKLNDLGSPLIFSENDKLGRVEPGIELDEDEVSVYGTSPSSESPSSERDSFRFANDTAAGGIHICYES